MKAERIRFDKLFNRQIQYMVPRWQRRYCWGEADIVRLIKDLATIAKNRKSRARHYGGALLTFPQDRRLSMVDLYQVIDGQQRLTTLSILLACIADALGDDGRCGAWTSKAIRNRLTNQDGSPDRFYKLRLQDGDEEAYQAGLEGRPAGAGAVAQAWKIVRRQVEEHGVETLLEGLNRLQVVHIELAEGDDPQQTFESLNATGRPLSETEKLKNWLLMGLPDLEQQRLHEGPWRAMEEALGARDSTRPIDQFLRDFLRWKTGELRGVNRVYEDLRRWAVVSGKDQDRESLCRELADVSRYYGMLLGGARQHRDRDVERELLHLREMGLHTHRPLTLRLLHEAAEAPAPSVANSSLAGVLSLIGTWITRSWLSDRAMAGMNKAFATMAHSDKLGESDDPVSFWAERIRAHRSARVAMPDDDEVGRGIKTRKAYGGSATRATKAILCALMEREQRGGAPARSQLTVEHIMPRTLTDAWRRDLGDDAEQVHSWFLNRIANLTLTGVNSELGQKPWSEKRNIIWKRSGVIENHRIAKEERWDRDAMDRRSARLCREILALWPWVDSGGTDRRENPGSATLTWRIGGGRRRREPSLKDALLNVVGELVSLGPENAGRLLGERTSVDLQLARHHPPDVKSGGLMMRTVPGHPRYTIYPYGSARGIASRIRELGARCDLVIEVEYQVAAAAFWKFVKAETGGLPGQDDGWRSNRHKSSPINALGDRIHVTRHDDWVGLYVRAHRGSPPVRTGRMLHASRSIREEMGDQEMDGDEKMRAEQGRTVTVLRRWEPDDESQWAAVARWIKEQADRLQLIADSWARDLDQVGS